ncbi:kinase-like domain-containing protein [Naematelia encephala]|uniref:Kinase-like domain-containing protein n=1 Tax=Naematelia encephala TaxID=71784 RepID=A0A1Y2AYI0_9TREE|nr:kinase-like domain-containing protein [Naematelia encephala]
MGIQGELRDHLLPQPSSFRKKREYTLQEVLGRGGFGKVVRAVWTLPNGEKRQVALKIISKKLVQDPKAVMDEINVLKGLDHPNIVHVWDHFESRDKYYLTFELATGGELFDRIQNRGKFTEKDAADCIRQVVSATAYLHAHKVVHRDLKPENILYRTREPDSQLVIADFGIARHLSVADEDGDGESSGGGGGGQNGQNGELTEQAGSLGYAAPEVLRGVGHGARVDCWSIGVIAYMLLCGYPPFRLDSKQELIRETMKGRIHFHERFWRKVSDTAKDFIKKMLVVDPKQRMSAAEALRHPWLVSGAATDNDLSGNLRANFNPRKKFVSAVRVVQATHRMRSASASASNPPSVSGLSVPIPTNITPLSTTDEEPDLTADEMGSPETFHTADEEHGHTLPPGPSYPIAGPSHSVNRLIQPPLILAHDHAEDSFSPKRQSQLQTHSQPQTQSRTQTQPQSQPQPPSQSQPPSPITTISPASDDEMPFVMSTVTAIKLEPEQLSRGTSTSQPLRKGSGGSGGIPSRKGSGTSISIPSRKGSGSGSISTSGLSTNVGDTVTMTSTSDMTRPSTQRRISPGLLPTLGSVPGLKGMMGRLGLGGGGGGGGGGVPANEKAGVAGVER